MSKTTPAKPIEASATLGMLPAGGDSPAAQFDRRALLVGGGVAALGFVGYACLRQQLRPKASVFIARNQTYAGDLQTTIADGLKAAGLNTDHLQGLKVLLKPNLVEPTRNVPQMTTHPAMIVAAAEVFRRFGAKVSVGEAPGHVRDTEMALEESGVGEALASAGLSFVDLNYDDVGWVENTSRLSPLKGLYFPQAVLAADLIVSMPKLKTHHWVGMTASLKNMYGILPGIKYGWPKNVLHHAGIPETVVDINALANKTITLVDAIDCMEGDGPIMGSLKHMGLVVVGINLTAVDATCARLMGLDPLGISYLQLAADRLGPLAENLIKQQGERWRDCDAPFEILDVPHLKGLRAAERVS